MTTAIGGTVRIGGEDVRLERVSSRKASRALALLRHINKAVPGLTHKWAEAEADYRRSHVRTLSRAEARLEFPNRVLIGADDRPVREPDTLPNPDPDGPETVPNPRAGELIMAPSPVDTITEADWEATGGLLLLPEDPPNFAPMVAAVFDEALELAESHVVRLLTLFTIRNEDVARLHKDGALDAELEARGERLLDESFADELLELAVVCGELVDDQFTRKASELGGRMGNALRLVGIGRSRSQKSTTENGPSSSTPSSSTDGPASSDGAPTSPSTPSSPSSAASPTSPTASEPSATPSEPASA